MRRKGVGYLLLVLLYFSCFGLGWSKNFEVLTAISPVYGMAGFAEILENNTRCRDELVQFREGVGKDFVWALKVLDASGILPPGFIYGNNLWIGSHYQCSDMSITRKLEINHEKTVHMVTPHDFPPFPVRFAVVHMGHNSTMQIHVRLPLDYTIQLGLCLPKSCTDYDILQLASKYFQNETFEMAKVYNFDVQVQHVRLLEENVFWLLKEPKTIALGTIICIVLVLTVVGTIVDIKSKKTMKQNLVNGHNSNLEGVKASSISTISSTVEFVNTQNTSKVQPEDEPSTLHKILICFSFPRNVTTLFRIKKSSDAISCIFGLRFVGMLWVILVHSIYFQADFTENPPIAYRLAGDFPSQVVSNSTYAVDTYLFLSGFLLGYLFYKNKNPHDAVKKPVNFFAKFSQFIMMYVNRYLRLTPPYALIILLSSVLYAMTRKSTVMYSSEMPDVVCDNYWWRNLLYINNLYPRKEMCLSWSWYLSLDTQFFTIASFLLILSTIYFKLSAILTVFLIMVNVVCMIYKSYSIGYIPTMDEQLHTLDAIYDLPWYRIGPYLVGIITAYLYVIRWQYKLYIPKRTKIILWSVFPLLNLWIVFTLYTRQLSVEFSAFYMGVSRTLWGVGIAWVTIACCTGNAGIVDTILSFKGFIPLSRLTYFAYLINPILAVMVAQNSEMPIKMSISQIAQTSMGIMFASFLSAFLLSMLFESPFIGLTKILISSFTKKQEKVVRTTENVPSESPKTEENV